MKKLISILLAVCMVLSLVGCISVTNSESDIQEPQNVETRERPQGGTPTVGADVTEAPASASVAETTAEPVEETVDAFADIVILDEAGVKVTTKGYNQQGDWFGPELKLLIENNSGKNLTFQCRNVSVNGYMVDTMMSVDVADGKKANDCITFSADSLSKCGINAVADIEFCLHVFDSDSWDGYLETSPISLKSANADKYEYVFDDSGTLAYDGEDAKIVIKGLEKSDYGDQSVIVYIENKTSDVIIVQVRDESVNGFMVDPIFSATVSAGKHAISDIDFMSYDLEENDIEEIENIELHFIVYDDDTFDVICETDTVSIDF